jgi:hypothetical protein
MPGPKYIKILQKFGLINADILDLGSSAMAKIWPILPTFGDLQLFPRR